MQTNNFQGQGLFKKTDYLFKMLPQSKHFFNKGQ